MRDVRARDDVAARMRRMRARIGVRLVAGSPTVRPHAPVTAVSEVAGGMHRMGACDDVAGGVCRMGAGDCDPLAPIVVVAATTAETPFEIDGPLRAGQMRPVAPTGARQVVLNGGQVTSTQKATPEQLPDPAAVRFLFARE